MGLLDKTATLTAGQDPGDTSTSGIGSLLSNSNLYNKAVAEGTINPNNVSLQDFDSFVVTNPDLVDPSIDVSGLRTTTDASILGNIPDYGGIQYEAYNPNRLSDLMRLYSGGFPMLNTDTAQIPGAIDTLVDAGGGGGGMDQATGDLDLGDTTITGGTNLNDYEGMGDMTGGITGDPIEMENLSPIDIGTVDDYDDLNDYENAVAAANISGTISGAPDVFDINETGDPALNPGSINVGDQPNPNSISTIVNPEIFDPYGASVNDPQIGDPGFENYISSTSIPDETLSTSISDIFTSAKNLGKSAIETAQELVDKGIGTYNDLNKTVTVPGLGEIDVGRTLAGLALNTAFNAPVSLAMYAMNQIPKSQSQIDYEGFSDEKKAAVDEIYGPGGVMEGYNAVSALGKGVDETIQERIDNFQKNYTAEELAAMSPTGTYAKLLDAKEKTGGTGINPNDQLDINNQINLEKELDDPPAYDDFPDNDPAPSVPEADNSIPDEYDEPDYDPGPFDYQVQPTNVYQDNNDGGGGGSTVDSSGNVTDSSGQSQGNINDEFSQPEATFEDQSYSGGGGNNNSSGKSIVCTAMYQTTGLEDWSKAMKIWYIYQKKYLTIQHQEGYHKLFKPFVKGMHKNKIIRAIGAHVAKHRTQDLKHIMFGSKSSWLGRVYRKILEPICYLVGKYAK